MTEEELLPFCECGKCGLRVKHKGDRFIHGHNNRGVHHPHTTPAQLAADKLNGDRQHGVPKPHTSPAQIAADETKRGVPNSPEHCSAISIAQLGVPLSPEHIAAIKKGLKDSGANEAKRGGHDICKHHYIYDHDDISKNTIKMTRSDHQKLHRLLQKLGYIIPHINVKEES